MADNETTADIIAWLRRPREGENAYLTLWRDEIADRLEAAHKRELSKNTSKNGADFGQLGDAAKLREALCEILSYIESFHKYITPSKDKKLTALFAVADTIRDKARAALSAPPRNCDVYNNESCRMAYHLNGDGLMTMQAFADWLFAPATEKEGGNNAD